jgi:hypothetical protein
LHILANNLEEQSVPLTNSAVNIPSPLFQQVTVVNLQLNNASALPS